jgi:PAS domain S-box-containing protein
MGIKKIKSQKLLEELQRTKEDLEDLEKYIEEFSTFLPLAVCSLNPLGMIIDANSAFEKLSGFGLMEFTGKPFATFFLEKKEVEKIVEGMSEKEIIEGKEFTFLAKGKKEIPVSLSFGSRKDKDGIFIGSFVGIFNLSELKKLQEGLEEKVKERTREFQERIDELERFHRLMVGRELKMIELKKEIKRLKEELEKYKDLHK